MDPNIKITKIYKDIFIYINKRSGMGWHSKFTRKRIVFQGKNHEAGNWTPKKNQYIRNFGIVDLKIYQNYKKIIFNYFNIYI